MPSFTASCYEVKLDYGKANITLLETSIFPKDNDKKMLSLTPQQMKETLECIEEIEIEKLPPSIMGLDGTMYSIQIESDDGEQVCEWWLDGGIAYKPLVDFKNLVLGCFGVRYESL